MLPPLLSLEFGELIVIADGPDTTIRIGIGQVRISEEGSFIDHILIAGQQYTIDRAGRAAVIAQTESQISLHLPRIALPPRSVERYRGLAGVELLYARSSLLDAVAALISSR